MIAQEEATVKADQAAVEYANTQLSLRSWWRHSTRLFLPQPVPRELVNEALALAQYAQIGRAHV